MKNALSFTLGLLCSFASFAQSLDDKKNTLPEIGVVASSAISIDKEKEVGDIVMRQLRGSAPVINDPLLEEYIQDLGNRLVAQAENVKFPFRFFLVNNQAINAFAFFGGNVGVHTGLIYHAASESELASVLAHEVAHVTQRHIARRILAQQQLSPLAIASTIGSILLALADPEAGIAALQASQAASQQASINYTRKNEAEADRIGLQVLARSGFDPNGATRFFRKLAEQSRAVSKPPQFLLTHPLPESRIADVRSRASALSSPNKRVNSMSFLLAKARILARFYGNPKYNITYFNRLVNQSSAQAKTASQYGLALSYLDNGDAEKAQEVLKPLIAEDPNNLFYIDASTDILLALGKGDLAIRSLQAQAEKKPRNRVISLNLANAALQNKQHELAIEVLKDYLLVNPDHMLSHQLLSDAYAEERKFLEMHQTKAEIFALLAAYPRAIDELHTAYNFADRSNLEKQRIRARIDQLRQRQDRLKAL